MNLLEPENRQNLIDALGEAQRIGMLGDEDLGLAIDRALPFAAAIPPSVHSFVDLGSGGGLPGLVVAMARPDLVGLLVDRRGKRVDLLVRLIGRLDLGGRTQAVEADVADLPRRFPGQQWPVATSRGFGSPEYTAGHARQIVVPGGLLMVSEPPASDGSRWATEPVRAAGFRLEEVVGGIAHLRRTDS
ncbi:MAG: putative ribosomal small subunit methyltransferase [Actinomycetota bacterium]